MRVDFFIIWKPVFCVLEIISLDRRDDEKRFKIRFLPIWHWLFVSMEFEFLFTLWMKSPQLMIEITLWLCAELSFCSHSNEVTWNASFNICDWHSSAMQKFQLKFSLMIAFIYVHIMMIIWICMIELNSTMLSTDTEKPSWSAMRIKLGTKPENSVLN